MIGETDAAAPRAGVGARLRDARERAGLTAIEAAERLHIDTAALTALEAERFTELGAPVYVRGYIRHYAELLGEPPQPLEDLYGASAHATSIPDLTRIAKVERPNAMASLLRPGITLLILAVLAGAGWWVATGLRGWRRPTRGGVVSALPPAPARAGSARGSSIAPPAPSTGAAGPNTELPSASAPFPGPGTGNPAASSAARADSGMAPAAERSSDGGGKPISQASSASPDGMNPAR